jgi:protein-S-isoprenylcysteine O-methyltransferase Ste14
MPTLGLALLGLYGLLAFGARMTVQAHRTGSTGFKGLRGASGPAERLGGSLFVVAVMLYAAGPALQVAGVLDSIQGLEGELTDVLGVVLTSLGIVGTVIAQFAMGDAWRVGVDPSEHTELVTHGPFSLVRNPIFAAMLPCFVGMALLAPNGVTIAGAILLVVALELQTRAVEEPYLLAVHGEQYAVYAARVGRFLPAIGRLRRSDRPPDDGRRPVRRGRRRPSRPSADDGH